MNIRNIAIIAHVDHGKTTMVDQLFKTAHLFRDNESSMERMMDSNDLERERGITILAKATGILYKDYQINILDTPGHADFGGEVERIMNMVDGCLLLIDAHESTMPQTRFVLKKAIEAHVKPIVVINKIDRQNVDIAHVLNDVLELFIALDAPEEYLNFKVVYASGLMGTSSLSPNPKDQKLGMEAILDLIISEIPSPNVTSSGHLRFQPSLLDYNDFVGRIGIGLVKSGVIRVGESIVLARLDGTHKPGKIMKLYRFFGMIRIELAEAHAGDIVGVAGISDINVGETICEPGYIEPLAPIAISEPTLQMTFAPNSSPFAGQAGKFVTFRQLQARLEKEIQRDVALKVALIEGSDRFLVSGRGELHLGILIENMRREGYELEVSKPKAIIKIIDGTPHEPFEELLLDVPSNDLGAVMEALASRQAEVIHIDYGELNTRLVYDIAAASLVGLHAQIMTLTKGYGLMSHTYKNHRPVTNFQIKGRSLGVLIASDTGMSTTYAIEGLEARGTMFITPQTLVYEGMIVGENRYSSDLIINVTKAKELTNMRMSTKEQKVVLKAPRLMSLENCLAYLNDDELLEITPTTFRMRKMYLTELERKRKSPRKTAI
ncbi:MAG: translational GTPase TypA [Bacilli bacterium]|jgi:GTP-binding protein